MYASLDVLQSRGAWHSQWMRQRLVTAISDFIHLFMRCVSRKMRLRLPVVDSCDRLYLLDQIQTASVATIGS